MTLPWPGGLRPELETDRTGDQEECGHQEKKQGRQDERLANPGHPTTIVRRPAATDKRSMTELTEGPGSR
jgi:hypothetical protein